MSTQIKSSLDDAKILDRYFNRRALSSLPQNTPTFQFGKIQWATDLVKMVNGQPQLQLIPNDLAKLQNVFHTNNAVYTYMNGVIHVRATLAVGELPEGQQFEFTACGILDEAGGLICVGITPPVWVYSDRSLVVEFEIHTNIA